MSFPDLLGIDFTSDHLEAVSSHEEKDSQQDLNVTADFERLLNEGRPTHDLETELKKSIMAEMEATIQARIAAEIAKAKIRWDQQQQSSAQSTLNLSQTRDSNDSSEVQEIQSTPQTVAPKKETLRLEEESQLTEESPTRKLYDARGPPNPEQGRLTQDQSRKTVQIALATPTRSRSLRDLSPPTGTLPLMERAKTSHQKMDIPGSMASRNSAIAAGRRGMTYADAVGSDGSEEPSSGEEVYSPTERVIRSNSAKQIANYERFAELDSGPKIDSGQHMQGSEEDPDWDLTYGGYEVAGRKKPSHLRPGTLIPEVASKVIKMPKIEVSEKYSGKDDRPLALSTWEAQMKLQLSKARVDMRSQYATIVALENLSNQASKWAAQTVQDDLQASISEDASLDMRRVASIWPLSRIVEHLQRRFVSPDDHARAETEWRTLTQEPSRGKRLTVQALENKLRDIAKRRIETTATDRKTKFVNALSTDIAMELHRAPHLRKWETRKDVHLKDLVEEAINIEQTLNFAKAREAERASDSKRENFELLKNKRRERNSQGGESGKQAQANAPKTKVHAAKANSNKATAAPLSEAAKKAAEERAALYEYRQTNNLFRWCGSKDHFRKDCTDKDAIAAYKSHNERKDAAKAGKRMEHRLKSRLLKCTKWLLTPTSKGVASTNALSLCLSL